MGLEILVPILMGALLKVAGKKFEELVRGRVHVDQRIEHGSDVTGVDIKRMGSLG